VGLTRPRNGAAEQDAYLESREAFQLRCQVLQDAQTVRLTAALRGGTHSLQFGPAELQLAQEGFGDISRRRCTSRSSLGPGRTNSVSFGATELQFEQEYPGTVAEPRRASRSSLNFGLTLGGGLGHRRRRSAVEFRDTEPVKPSPSMSSSRRSSISRILGTVRIKQGRDPSSDSPKYLASQLCQVCRDGDLEWVRVHVKNGADVNGVDAENLPALHYAVLRGDLLVAKLLVEKGALVGGSDGQNPGMLLLAVSNGDTSMLKYLLEKSAPVSSSGWDRRNRQITPLELAVKTGNSETTRILLDHGAKLHGVETSRKGLDPLCLAVDKRHPEIVKLLLDNHAHVNGAASVTTWGSGLAPIHVAAYLGYDDILGILLDAGADVATTCQRGNGSGVTALHLATGGCAKLLIQRGADILQGDSLNQYPLSGAVQVRDISSVKVLLQHGAPVNAADAHNDTALQITCKLFANDAKASKPENLAAYRDIAGELLAWKASVGSRLSARITIRDTCKRLLQAQHPPVDGTKLELMELMDRIVELVKPRPIRSRQPSYNREILANAKWSSGITQLAYNPVV